MYINQTVYFFFSIKTALGATIEFWWLYVCSKLFTPERIIYSTKNLVNRNDAYLFDERLEFGLVGILDKKSSKWDRPIYSTNYQGMR